LLLRRILKQRKISIEGRLLDHLHIAHTTFYTWWAQAW
jgi:hypothetical protein